MRGIIIKDWLVFHSSLTFYLPLNLSHRVTLLSEDFPYSRMLQFLAGFTLGNVVGMYLAQNYDVPNIAKKIEDFKKDVEAKKKPPE